MKSIVVKLGSSSVTRTTGPDPVVLTSALDAALHARSLGWSVTLVTSGAVSSGAAYLTRASDVRPSSRLAAAVGQPFLMDIYRSVSEISGKHVCQILISEDDLRSPAAVAVGVRGAERVRGRRDRARSSTGTTSPTRAARTTTRSRSPSPWPAVRTSCCC